MPNQRSFTGHHTLLPAVNPSNVSTTIQQPAVYFIAWTFGRGSVIWRIWPAVLLHTAFAALVVSLRIKLHFYELGIPTVMLTVLGVVIGFVISYRAMSGYDRYWMGRTAWSDVIRNARTIGRLIWIHVPPRITPSKEHPTPIKELKKVMAEKRMALDLLQGFCVALKHHLRAEVGIYYQDLYHLVKPLHDHDHEHSHSEFGGPPPRSRAHRITSNPSMPTTTSSQTQGSSTAHDIGTSASERDPIIPPINAYGTFNPANPTASLLKHQASTTSIQSTSSSTHPLLPSQKPLQTPTLFSKISQNLIPFAGVFSTFFHKHSESSEQAQERQDEVYLHPKLGGGKHRLQPRENLPLEILRCLSEWCSVLEDRGTVPGTSLGALVGQLAGMEDALTTLEKILTTPLPFVYAVHIRHTVWIYLFFLPFQLVNDFGWYTIPGVGIAAFIYLGFLAAGEEIEGPFGYDENDLELDMYCRDIIHVDIENLKRTPCLNAWFPEHSSSHPRSNGDGGKGSKEEMKRHRSVTLVGGESDGSDEE